METLVSADLLSSEPDGYRGCLDGFEPESGLLGWVVNLQRPAEQITLRFYVDGMIISEIVASQPRPDVCAAAGRMYLQPGFCIPTSELRPLTHLIALRPLAEFSVEIGTTSLFLPRAEGVPTLQDIVFSSIEVHRSKRPEIASLERLIRTVADAQTLTLLPLRPFEETRIGFVEAVSEDDQNPDLTWIIGWTTAVDLRELPVVIVDGRKYPGAITGHRYNRSDLPNGALGFVGVIHSQWRVRQTSSPIFYIGTSARNHLASVEGLPKISKEDFLAYVDQHLDVDGSAKYEDFHALLTSSESWVVRRSVEADVQIGIDRVILAPRSGYFVSGWVLSSVRGIESFVLKVGSSVMPMDVTSLICRPRPDLISAFPAISGLVERAGFVCFFPGYVEATNSNLRLKVLLDHGPAVVHPVEATHVRRLGETIPLDSLLDFYPKIENERFFRSVSINIKKSYLERCRIFDVLSIHSMKEAFIIVLPVNRDDCYLLLEEIRKNATKSLPSNVGLVFIVDYSHKHGEVCSLLNELQSELSTPVAIVAVPEVLASFYVLKDLLVTIGMSRFFFLAANELLTKTGWNAVSKFFTSPTNLSIIMEAIDAEFPQKTGNIYHSFGCDWNTYHTIHSKIETQIATQLTPLRCLTNELGEKLNIIKAGTFFTRRSIPDRLSRLVNQLEEGAVHAVRY